VTFPKELIKLAIISHNQNPKWESFCFQNKACRATRDSWECFP